MSTDSQNWQKHHVGTTSHQPNRRIQNREQVEDPQGKRGGVFEVSVKIDLND